MLKTSGLVDVLKNAIGEDSSILSSFIYGSFATGVEKASSDMNLLVIGCIGLRKLSKLLSIAEYDYVDSVTKNDADELIAFVKGFKADVLKWLAKFHPEFSR